MEYISENAHSTQSQHPQNTSEETSSLPEEVSTALLSYTEKIFQVSSLSGWLLFLKSNTPKYFAPGEFILFYESPQFGLRRAYIKNKRFYEEVAQTPWNIPPLLSFNSSEMNLYLAREMGRPFSKVLAVPLYEKDDPILGSTRSPILLRSCQKVREKNNRLWISFRKKRIF